MVVVGGKERKSTGPELQSYIVTGVCEKSLNYFLLWKWYQKLRISQVIMYLILDLAWDAYLSCNSCFTLVEPAVQAKYHFRSCCTYNGKNTD